MGKQSDFLQNVGDKNILRIHLNLKFSLIQKFKQSILEVVNIFLLHLSVTALKASFPLHEDSAI